MSGRHVQRPPKKHHYVAVMQLARFADEKGLIWVHDKRTGQPVRQTKPDAVFFENHLYSRQNSDGTKDTWLESFFADVEGRADVLIQKVVEAARAKRLPKLSDEEKATWNQFFYYQWKRTPGFLKEAGFDDDFPAVYRGIVEDFERENGPLPPAARPFAPENVKEMKDHARVMALAQPGVGILNVLAKMGLGIGIPARPNKSFIIGSKPVAKLSASPGATLGSPAVEIWLPIAHDVIACMVPNGGKEIFAKLPDRDIRALNLISFRESPLVAAQSEAVLKSLLNAR